MLTTALQGHTYRDRFTGRKLMAMENGDLIEAFEMDDTRPWPLTRRVLTDVGRLEPLPMTYFGGQVPQAVTP